MTNIIQSETIPVTNVCVFSSNITIADNCHVVAAELVCGFEPRRASHEGG